MVDDKHIIVVESVRALSRVLTTDVSIIPDRALYQISGFTDPTTLAIHGCLCDAQAGHCNPTALSSFMILELALGRFMTIFDPCSLQVPQDYMYACLERICIAQ